MAIRDMREGYGMARVMPIILIDHHLKTMESTVIGMPISELNRMHK